MTNLTLMVNYLSLTRLLEFAYTPRNLNLMLVSYWSFPRRRLAIREYISLLLRGKLKADQYHCPKPLLLYEKLTHASVEIISFML